jgi:hypothetical protein
MRSKYASFSGFCPFCSLIGDRLTRQDMPVGKIRW